LLLLYPGLPATAEVLYSGLLDTAISTDFDGVTLNIAGGILNPFFGGVGVANNNLLQPYREGSGNLDTLLNLSAGTVINASSATLSTGYGGSQDHLGTTFTAGQEGYIGFKLNGANHGWVRVVFTNNTGGALIKDWAYDNSGLSIATGNVLQNGSTVTLNSASGSFTLGSLVSGSSSVVKSGAGTVTLTEASTYTGTTAVNAGTLTVNNTSGSGTGSGIVAVSGGELAGSGSIAGGVNVSTLSTISPGAGVGNLTIYNGLVLGGTYQWQLGALSTANPGMDYDTLSVITGNADLTSASLGLNLGDYTPSSAPFWQTNRTWEGIISLGTGALTGGSGFSINTDQWSWASLGLFSTTTPEGSDQVNLVWTAIPEPNGTLLVGGGALLCLLRRRRTKGVR
jgi:autotransporter-associated beta strand protein